MKRNYLWIVVKQAIEHMLLQMQGPRSDLKDGGELKSGGGRRMGSGGLPHKNFF